ncbi:unnamed protein product [Echinostoma caproni]|uniref:THAP-type domain-containing protein n=1 Tax=Echinostoma caproni TaxID=27848 RepID=A0A183AGC5_9TREM|nr:unnamed protein product [Echinostoma caproni]
MSQERSGIKYSDLFKVPYSRAPKKWKSINMLLEDWGREDIGTREPCKSPTPRDTTLSQTDLNGTDKKSIIYVDLEAHTGSNKLLGMCSQMKCDA